MSSELITALCACLVALAALFGALTSYFKSKDADQRLKNIESSDLKGFYIICPSCGQKVELVGVKIYKEVSK